MAGTRIFERRQSKLERSANRESKVELIRCGISLSRLLQAIESRMILPRRVAKAIRGDDEVREDDMSRESLRSEGSRSEILRSVPTLFFSIECLSILEGFMDRYWSRVDSSGGRQVKKFEKCQSRILAVSENLALTAKPPFPARELLDFHFTPSAAVHPSQYDSKVLVKLEIELNREGERRVSRTKGNRKTRSILLRTFFIPELIPSRLPFASRSSVVADESWKEIRSESTKQV